jgi:hypothetical protein
VAAGHQPLDREDSLKLQDPEVNRIIEESHQDHAAGGRVFRGI